MHLSEVDLLSSPLKASADVSRQGGAFLVDSAWALAKFGKLQLEPGWWRLECRGGPAHAELRLSSDRDPLIVIPAGAGSARIHIGDAGGYYLSLLVSPWPGSYAFSKLKLRRLGPSQLLKMALGAAGRLARHRQPLPVLRRAARRLMAGQALGLSVAAQQAHSGERPVSQEGAERPRVAASYALRSAFMLSAQAGDRIHHNAIAIVGRLFEQNPHLRTVYADVVEGGKLIPHPEWDAELGASGAFDNVPVFSRSDAAVSRIEEAVERWGRRSVARIPLPLVERNAAAPLPIVSGLQPQFANPPLVSIVIPTKYRMDLLETCVQGLVQKTGYPDIEIIVVDNGVVDPRFPGLLDPARARFKVQVIEDKGPFNFSRLVNAGVKKASGQIILLLNDDIEPLQEGWLHRMVASAMPASAGAVGAQLLYPDRSIQHAGVVLGLGGTCAHLWRGIAASSAAGNVYIQSVGGRRAVTGACLAVRRSAFDLVGGFDETNFPVAYNDIDFCLRLYAQGLRNVYRGDAVLVHHESKSRGSDEASVASHKRQSIEAARFLQRWRGELEGDPSFSPAFDPLVETGVAHVASFAPSSEYVDPTELA